MTDKNTIFDRLNTVFQDVFDDEKLTVNESTTAEDIEEWDSLRHITLIASVESEFGMKFTMKEVLSMENVGAMAEIIAARGTK